MTDPVLPPPRAEGRPGPGLRSVDAVTLFAGAREIVIVHRGLEYRLRITRSDRLILTK